MTQYQTTAQRRFLEEKKALSARYHRAWNLAKQGADLLKKQFGAKQVAAFGSLVHKDLFHIRSDVDLAVWGMNQKGYYRAVGQLLSFDPDIQIDVVMMEEVKESLRLRIEQEGVLL